MIKKKLAHIVFEPGFETKAAVNYMIRTVTITHVSKIPYMNDNGSQSTLCIYPRMV